ncbi:competence protein [Thermus thermophilus]|uniref:competence protein n=1 Tax=Thermus thermophilus TaxID=274 RepID=UPI001FCC12B2|nr:competence protein [Thermus thermophilus]BDG24324.1 competence protein [Thermus thermophilus]BDG26007.1 competence protein [Thermus thermophilus]BDG28434.1 competence protein [Thermus thermophilus]
MKNAWQRLKEAWANLPRSTKLLLAALLLVGGVALWYVGLYLPAQVAEAPTPAPSTQVIEAPPIPPLASQEEAKPQAEAPAQEEAQAPASSQEEAQAPPPAPVARAEPPPPNPFVPLVVETPPPPPASASRPTPVPEGPAVRVQTPAPAPQAAPATRPIPGTSGALPAPKILSPALSAPLPQARETPPRVAVPTALVEAPLPGPEEKGAEKAPTPASPLERLVAEKGLRLSGTLLGPVSVAILESKEGYLVVPVGSPIPGTEAVVRQVEEGSVTLALKEETLNLSLVQAGGGQ